MPSLGPLDSPGSLGRPVAVFDPLTSLFRAFEAEVALVRNGASVPITELIQRVLGVDPVLMGFGLPDDNLQAPNERFRLEQFHGGIAAAAAMLHNLAELK